MKILWLSHIVPYPPKGGVLQRSFHLLRELSARHEVHLVSFVQAAPLERVYGSVEKGLADCRAKLSPYFPLIRFVPIPSEQRPWGKKWLLFKSIFTRDPYNINWLKSRAMRKELARLAAAENYDVVHFDTISLGVYRDLFNGVSTAMDHHAVESHMMLRRAQKERSWLARLYLQHEGARLQRYEQQYCRRFDVHFTCSSLDSERLDELLPGIRTVVVPNGVDVDYFKPVEGQRRSKTLVFAGRLSQYTNRIAVEFLAEQIWPALKREIPDVEIDIIGADPPPAVVDLGRRDPTFRVHGFVDDVRDYMNRASAYICPIRDGGGTKLKILDALAMGLPIVADPVSCEGIDTVDGESVLHASSVADYVAQAKRLFGDEALQRRMAVNARRLVEKSYAYGGIGERLCAAYEELVKQEG